MNFTIRNCLREDLVQVHELEQICFPGSPVLPMVGLVQYFDLFQNTFVVTESQGVVVGFAIMGTCSLDPKLGWLLDVAVAESFRARGCAKAMLKPLIGRLKEAGVCEIRATVSPKNSASRTMLEKLGFKVFKEVDEYFGKGEARLVLANLTL